MRETKHRAIDTVLAIGMARLDMWGKLCYQAKKWKEGQVPDEEIFQKLKHILSIETFYAYPGKLLVADLDNFFKNKEKSEFLKLATEITLSIVSKYYKNEDSHNTDSLHKYTINSNKGVHKPYFEVLVVAGDMQGFSETIVNNLLEQRRPEDEFIYDIILVDSFQDAFGAIAVNSNINSVIIYDTLNYESKLDIPIIDEILEELDAKLDDDSLALQLIDVIKAYRPELDLFLVTGGFLEDIASAPKSKNIERVFYAIEESMELHLSLLEAIHRRYETPFFNNLKAYARKPVSTFHALPIARGKSIFKSDWIRDFGEFYGINLFLAESSATTGGLDSLLEPTGNIKVAQEKAAKAFGADHCYFVTNGTSTSNKIVLMAIAEPDDIVIIDRNCHKSHHYAMVLGGIKPYYVEAFPLTKYSMYGAVPLRSIKTALLKLKDEGKLHKVKAVDLTNCTFDGHVYNTKRVMEECLAIKPDLVFVWDEAWFGFARWSPLLRQRTAMGAADAIEKWMGKDSSVAAYEAQQSLLGPNPTTEELLNVRLIPDPRQIKLRVYQNNSTHKSLSAIRQGSMILVKDADFYSIEPQLHEAIFTHSTTSPNQQIIASLDIARRQMELEGYSLVGNAIQIALDIRYQIMKHPIISKYFSILTPEEMIPEDLRESGVKDFFGADLGWGQVAKIVRDDEFFLDPTRMTLICGTAGFNGTEFKNILANKYNIQLNKTSRNSVLLQSNINNTRSDVAQLIKVLLEISMEIEESLNKNDEAAQKIFNAKVKNLMEDVPDLPNFSHFHESLREDVNGEIAIEGDIRKAFYRSWRDEYCEYVPLFSEECDRRLKEGPAMISAKMVIPYPPGFPILVPGQVISQDVIDFMRKLDVKEIHGYEIDRGLQLLKH